MSRKETYIFAIIIVVNKFKVQSTSNLILPHSGGGGKKVHNSLPRVFGLAYKWATTLDYGHM